MRSYFFQGDAHRENLLRLRDKLKNTRLLDLNYFLLFFLFLFFGHAFILISAIVRINPNKLGNKSSDFLILVLACLITTLVAVEGAGRFLVLLVDFALGSLFLVLLYFFY